jgi:hypothetical protein
MKKLLYPLKRWGTSPQNDWLVMFSVFVFCLAVAIAWSLSVFGLVRSSSADDASSASGLLNVSAIHRTALFYDRKAAELDLIKLAPDTTPDPSK